MDVLPFEIRAAIKGRKLEEIQTKKVILSVVKSSEMQKSSATTLISLATSQS